MLTEVKPFGLVRDDRLIWRLRFREEKYGSGGVVGVDAFFDACQRSGPVKRRKEDGGLWPEM